MESVFDNTRTLPFRPGEASPLRRLSPELLNSLDQTQQKELEQAMVAANWQRHPVNIRLSLPWVTGRYYLTIVSGKEKRSSERLISERKEHRLATLGNCLFMVGAACFFYLVFFGVIALQSRLVEF